MLMRKEPTAYLKIRCSLGYLLKLSLNSTISVMALDIAGIFSAFLVEQIFGYPGLSNYGLTAMLNKDVFAVSAVVMVLGIIVIIFNLLADLVISLRPTGKAQEKRKGEEKKWITIRLK